MNTRGKNNSLNRLTRKVAYAIVAAVTITSTFTMVPQKVEAASQPKIHYITINDNNNAIVVECDGHFGMIDSGEDSDRPDGSDWRYPLRPGISTIGYERQVISYMKSIGVNSSNLDFYIGTHPHSDHIGSADEVIREFKPKRVYIGEYSDSMVYNSSNLWDNLYVYDKMIAAANDVGATIIQKFTEDTTKDLSAIDEADGAVSKKSGRDIIVVSWSGDNGFDDKRPQQLNVVIERRKLSQDEDEVLLEESTDESDVSSENETSETEISEEDIENADELLSNNTDDEEDIKTVDQVDEVVVAEEELPEEDVPEENVATDDVAADEEIEEISHPSYIEEEILVEESYIENNINLVVETISQSVDLQEEAKWETIESLTMSANELGQWEIEPEMEFEEGYEYRLVCDEIENYSLEADNDSFVIYARYQGNDMENVALEDGFSIAAEDGKTEVGDASFMLGSNMRITIMNTDVDRYKGWNDANDFSWGVLVEANDKRVFCSGDINNINGCEDKLLSELGHVDLLTLGHHGFKGSSSSKFVKGLNPSKIVICGTFNAISNAYQFNGPGVFDTLLEMGNKGTRIYATGLYSDRLTGLVFNFDSNMSNNIPDVYTFGTTNPDSAQSKSMLLKGGRISQELNCFWECNGVWRFFENSYLASKSKWVIQNGKYYYLDERGDYVTGWHKVNGIWYHHRSTGALDCSKWYKENGSWYYLKPSGAMAVGWQKVGSKWYYLKNNGIMAVGWLKLGNKWYYLESSGAMASGWKYINGHYYFFSGEGSMVNGWREIGKKWYYFDEYSGKLATSTWIGNYYVNANGVWVDTR